MNLDATFLLYLANRVVSFLRSHKTVFQYHIKYCNGFLLHVLHVVCFPLAGYVGTTGDEGFQTPVPHRDGEGGSQGGRLRKVCLVMLSALTNIIITEICKAPTLRLSGRWT